MQYEVEIEGKTLYVNVEKAQHDQLIDSKNDNLLYETKENGADISYELAKAEYDYCLHRSEKLDNKIYILLTVCAFLISIVIGIAGDLRKIEFPQKIVSLRNTAECAIWIGTGIELLIFIAAVIILILALWSIDIHRFDQTEILNFSEMYKL